MRMTQTLDLELDVVEEFPSEHPYVAYETMVVQRGPNIFYTLEEFVAKDEYEADYFSRSGGYDWLARKMETARAEGYYPKTLADPQIGFSVVAVSHVSNHTRNPQAWSRNVVPDSDKMPYMINPRTRRIQRVER